MKIAQNGLLEVRRRYLGVPPSKSSGKPILHENKQKRIKVNAILEEITYKDRRENNIPAVNETIPKRHVLKTDKTITCYSK